MKAAAVSLVIAVGLATLAAVTYGKDQSAKREWAREGWDAVHHEQRAQNNRLRLSTDELQLQLATGAAAAELRKKIAADQDAVSADGIGMGPSSAQCAAEIAAIDQRAWIPIVEAIAACMFLVAGLALRTARRRLIVSPS